MAELSKIRKNGTDYDIKDKTARDELEELKKKVPEEGLENGATFTPHVDEEGNLSWSNDKGLKNPDTVNIKGTPGNPGKTPEKGSDYYTEADKTEMVNAVLSALPTWTGGSY